MRPALSLALRILLQVPAPPQLPPPAVAPVSPPRTIAIDSRLAQDAPLSVGDRIAISREPPGSAPTGAEAARESVTVAAIFARGADPSEIARSEYRVRLHLDQLQSLVGNGDRVDRFAVGTRSAGSVGTAIDAINGSAFGFRAYRSRDIAVETSRTFLVVSRFHRAIGVITVIASATFLLCIMLLKVDERRRDVAALRLMGISRRTVIRSVVLEAAAIAVAGSVIGVVVGIAASLTINAHYRAVYSTPLTFAFVTPGIALFAVGLSIVLGVGAGYLAALRLVTRPPLELLGR